MAFQEGDRVEVCSKEQGFLGSYYSATVIKKLDSSSYAVQYDNLMDDKDMSKQLIETVSVDEMRPMPPRIKLESGFSLFDEVDAFDNDGWWGGKITRKRGSMLRVYFETTGQEIAYHVSRLRVHSDWVNGRWVSSKKIGS